MSVEYSYYIHLVKMFTVTSNDGKCTRDCASYIDKNNSPDLE